MSTSFEVRVPDLGQAGHVEVIEIPIQVGQHIDSDTTLVTVESEKASMDIPSTKAGDVQSIAVRLGDKVSKGDLILTMELIEADKTTQSIQEKKEVMSSSQMREVWVPDIGGAKSVTVLEINVSPGDSVEKEDTLVTLESEKASMEIPAKESGIIREIKIKTGESVSEGSLIMVMEVRGESNPKSVQEESPKKKEITTAQTAPIQTAPVPPVNPQHTVSSMIHTTPAIRRLATEFGLDLKQIVGTGRKGRILREDVQNYVKSRLNQSHSGGGLSVLEMPQIDFKQFGEIEETSLSRIKKISAENLHRNWVTIPHVTQFDEVDITEMESFRQANKGEAEKAGYKLTPLVILLKAVAKTLQAFPTFNASLDKSGERLILKKYYHVGFAVDTPKGLVVPVIRHVESKGLFALAKELGEISQKARALKLTPAEMQGGCFTISSLGGIGGTAFTPIINAPEVAILGVSKSQMKPIFKEGSFEPRLMLPLSLSYDHRVIDGAEAARFITYLSGLLADIRRLLL